MHLHNSQSFQLILLNLQISVQKDASPCASKHSSTSSEKNVLKAFFDITFVDKAVNSVPIIYTWEAKTLFSLSFYKTVWTRVRTCQNGHATPLA